MRTLLGSLSIRPGKKSRERLDVRCITHIIKNCRLASGIVVTSEENLGSRLALRTSTTNMATTRTPTGQRRQANKITLTSAGISTFSVASSTMLEEVCEVKEAASRSRRESKAKSLTDLVDEEGDEEGDGADQSKKMKKSQSIGNRLQHLTKLNPVTFNKIVPTPKAKKKRRPNRPAASSEEGIDNFGFVTEVEMMEQQQDGHESNDEHFLI